MEISEAGRGRLGMASCIIHGLLAIFGLCLAACGGYMKYELDSKLMILEGYNTDTLPYYFVTVGGLMFLINSLVSKASYDSSEPETRARFQNFLVFFLVLLFILIWLIFAASMLCFSHRYVIEQSFKNGLFSVMKRYKTDMTIKVTIDDLQLRYRCCGSNSYTDWFKINWVNEDFINVKHPDVKK